MLILAFTFPKCRRSFQIASMSFYVQAIANHSGEEGLEYAKKYMDEYNSCEAREEPEEEIAAGD